MENEVSFRVMKLSSTNFILETFEYKFTARNIPYFITSLPLLLFVQINRSIHLWFEHVLAEVQHRLLIDRGQLL